MLQVASDLQKPPLAKLQQNPPNKPPILPLMPASDAIALSEKDLGNRPYHEGDLGPLTHGELHWTAQKRATFHWTAQASSQNLSWINHSTLATTSRRIHYINRTVTHIKRLFPERDKPLTLISYASGALLAEHLIHQRLVRLGFKNIRWRCIDSMYARQAPACRSLSREFQAGKSHVKFFGYETEYLAAQKQLAEQAKSDRDAGGIVLLSIAPPIPFDVPHIADEQIEVSGEACDDKARKYANTLFLLHYAAKNTTELQQNSQALSHIANLVNNNTLAITLRDKVTKVLIDGHDVQIEQPYADASRYKTSIRNFILQELARIGQPNGTKGSSPVTILETACNKIQSNAGRGKLTRPLFVNDAEFGLSRLQAFAQASEYPALFSELRRNLVETKTL